jgi:hypothetical protein
MTPVERGQDVAADVFGSLSLVRDELTDLVAEAVSDALTEERLACARLARGEEQSFHSDGLRMTVAEAILARGAK